MYYYYPSSRGETERMHWDHKEGKAREVGATVAVKASGTFSLSLLCLQKARELVPRYCCTAMETCCTLERERERNHKVKTVAVTTPHTSCIAASCSTNCHSCCSCMVAFEYHALTIAKVPHKVVRFWPWPVPSSQREKRLCVFLVLVRAREREREND